MGGVFWSPLEKNPWKSSSFFILCYPCYYVPHPAYIRLHLVKLCRDDTNTLKVPSFIRDSFNHRPRSALVMDLFVLYVNVSSIFRLSLIELVYTVVPAIESLFRKFFNILFSSAARKSIAKMVSTHAILVTHGFGPHDWNNLFNGSSKWKRRCSSCDIIPDVFGLFNIAHAIRKLRWCAMIPIHIC